MRISEDEAKDLQRRGRKLTGAVSNEPDTENAPRNAGLRQMQAQGRLKAGKLNKTEQEYDEELKLMMTAKAIVWYRWHPLNLKLADGLYYRPDVMVMLQNGLIEVHEVKGWWTDDALVKIKVAANQFPFKFLAVSKEAKKNGGGWKYRAF